MIRTSPLLASATAVCLSHSLAFLVALSAFAAPSLQAQTFTVIYAFQGGPNDGSEPAAPPVRDAQGNLYGTTGAGGTKDWGTVYKIAASGTETLLHSFTGGADGVTPTTGLVRDAQGNLYGMTYTGGSTNCFDGGGCGAVYELSPSQNGWTETILYAFHGGKDGALPGDGTLALDTDGNLYGTTLYGGGSPWPNGGGVVFKLTKTSKGWEEQTLYAFSPDSDGTSPSPYGGVILDSAGNIYGTTYYGGSYGLGSVFKIDPSGAETVLYNFTGGADGADPMGALVLDGAGNLYGATPFGGDLSCLALYPLGCGTVFKVDPSGTETVLHTFVGPPHDGDGPSAPLVLDNAGNLYGTAGGGNSKTCRDTNQQPSGCGVIFEVNPAGKETILYNFSAGESGTDPIGPVGVVRYGGSLYGATFQGGNGAVFKFTK
jgi:uncharacterized repeat protein (TIGR03803 family)